MNGGIVDKASPRLPLLLPHLLNACLPPLLMQLAGELSEAMILAADTQDASGALLVRCAIRA